MLHINFRTCLWLASVTAAAGLSGCHRTVVRQRTPAGEQPSEVTISSPGTAATKDKPVGTFVTTQPSPPPAPPTEVRTPAPDPNAVWVPGAYDWENGRWQWTAGHWLTPSPPSSIWVPGRWEAVPGGWEWQPGHWR